jgi:hypothetical protein
MPSNFHKNINSLISTKKENMTLKTVTESEITYPFLWTLCDRTILTANTTNYFSSFNLPFESDNFSSGSTLSNYFPELQQLNVDKFLIGTIDRSHYSEYIDGRSISLRVPQKGVGNTVCGVTVVSSTYHTLEKSQNNPLLGNNVAFLFSDSINYPYTGTTDGGTNSASSVTTWNTSSYLQRPAAVSYSNLQSTDVNSDQRTWSNVRKAIGVPESYPTTTNQGYNYDIPIGYVSLNKGFIVITHPNLVNNVPWGLGLINNTTSNPTSATTNIGFTAVNTSNVSFYDVDTEYITSVVCIALPGEFYFSNNETWDYASNLEEYQLGTNNFDDTYVTEIGLYNKNNELVAIAKLDRPKEKGYTELLTFNLQINV